MDIASKHIILSHLYWIDNNISKEKIINTCQDIKKDDIFSSVNFNQIQKKLGYRLFSKEFFDSTDYEKLKYLWLNFSNTNIDLSFVRYCTNLEEINIGCFDVVNLEALKYNTKLKSIIANNNKITNIEALYAHNELEYLNVENNPSCSIQPIAHLKKIKKIEAGIIQDELAALTILKNNSICKLDYIINGEETDFNNFKFPFYHVLITRNENEIKIILEAISTPDKFSEALDFPKEILKDNTFFENYIIAAQNDISKRFKTILGESFKVNVDELIYYHNYYMFEYSHQLL